MTDKSFYGLAIHEGENLPENYRSVSIPFFNGSVFAFADA